MQANRACAFGHLERGHLERGHQKTPAAPGEGSVRFSVVPALALDPPRSSVLPPGAGNEAKKAGKTELERPKKTEERYIDQTCVLDGDLHAAAVRRHRDSNRAPIPTVEQVQCALPDHSQTLRVSAV